MAGKEGIEYDQIRIGQIDVLALAEKVKQQEEQIAHLMELIHHPTHVTERLFGDSEVLNTTTNKE